MATCALAMVSMGRVGTGSSRPPPTPRAGKTCAAPVAGGSKRSALDLAQSNPNSLSYSPLPLASARLCCGTPTGQAISLPLKKRRLKGCGQDCLPHGLRNDSCWSSLSISNSAKSTLLMHIPTDSIAVLREAAVLAWAMKGIAFDRSKSVGYRERNVRKVRRSDRNLWRSGSSP